MSLSSRSPIGSTLASACAMVLGGVCLLASPSAAATTLPDGFAEQTAIEGLTEPTAVDFAPDGRIFVAEKSGLIKSFSGPDDTTADTVADLRTQVHSFWDRGLLDIAVDPDFTRTSRLFALYTFDAELGGTAPRWGEEGVSSDPCPTPPGPTTGGCVVSGRLVAMELDGSVAGPEQVLLEDWCQQFPSHSVGGIAFDRDGALYVSGGDGASFHYPDYGQAGDPPNPCGDPPFGAGTSLYPPLAEGGALRSQDLRTTGDPTGLNGTIARVDPDDGTPLPDNPNLGGPDANAQRIIATGLRNPFRIAVRPGTDEVWAADVGGARWEEINRQRSDRLVNHGWPCYEGPERQPGFQARDLALCDDLYDEGSATPPEFAYRHDEPAFTGDPCSTGSSAISGLGFYDAEGPFPGRYEDTLFVSDYGRDCIWAIPADGTGAPEPAEIEAFAAGAGGPVDLTAGPDGALYYADFDAGRIEAIRYFAANQPPTAVLAATPSSGSAPLDVDLDASASFDPDGDPLGFEWDLDDDGDFDDATGPVLARTLSTKGAHRIRVRVSDPDGASDVGETQVSVDNTAPEVQIEAPNGVRWSVGERIEFAAAAADPEEGGLGPEAFDWELVLHHCPSDCHTHPVQRFEGRAEGSFHAPDHEYRSHLELKVTATDGGGLSASDSIEIHPRTSRLRLTSSPRGAELSLNGEVATAPFERTVIRGSSNSISAPASVELGGIPYEWQRWAHGGSRSQNAVVDGEIASLEAGYAEPAGSVSFQPSDDTWIDAARPGHAAGASPLLRADGLGRKDALLRFEVTGLRDRQVRSARLRLYSEQASSGAVAHELRGGWSEDDASWASAPPAGPPFASIGPLERGEFVDLDVSGVVRAEGAFGFRLSSQAAEGAAFASKERGPGRMPQLIVTTGPEPPPPPPSLSFEADADVTLSPAAGATASIGRLRVDGAPRSDVLLRFATEGIGQQPISSAVLQLHARDAAPSGGRFRITDTSWTEDAVDWSTAPRGRGAARRLGNVSTGSWHQLDVSSLLSGDGQLSLRVATANPDAAIYSSRHGDGGFAPRLFVDLGQPSLRLAPPGVAARIDRVLSPWTVRVRVPREGRRRIKLAGVGERAGRCGRRIGRRALRGRLPVGRKVRLLADPIASERDRKGRFVRYLSDAGGDPVRDLLARGKLRAARASGYERREDYARAASRGRERPGSVRLRCRRGG